MLTKYVGIIYTIFYNKKVKIIMIFFCDWLIDFYSMIHMENLTVWNKKFAYV